MVCVHKYSCLQREDLLYLATLMGLDISFVLCFLKVNIIFKALHDLYPIFLNMFPRRNLI